MKLILFCWLSLSCFTSICQKSTEPLFSFLSEVKNTAEFKLKTILKEQSLITDTLPDSSASGIQRLKQKLALSYFKDNSTCVTKYMTLKTDVDKLISQLKADLTISNRKSIIVKLNKGTIDNTSFYYELIKQVHMAQKEFLDCGTYKANDISVSDITGIFSELVTIFTSARDFRAQQIKSLCDQLDKFALSDPYDLSEETHPVSSSKD